MREKHVDAIGMILQSIDWSAVKMSATSPAGDRFLVDGVSPDRLRITVCVTVEVDPASPRGQRSRGSERLPATGRGAPVNGRAVTRPDATASRSAR